MAHLAERPFTSFLQRDLLPICGSLCRQNWAGGQDSLRTLFMVDPFMMTVQVKTEYGATHTPSGSSCLRADVPVPQ